MSKRSKADAERSKIEAEKMRLTGKSDDEIRAQLGGTRVTTWRWLKDAEKINWAVLGMEELAPLKKAFVEQVTARADDVLAGRLSPEAASAWRGLMDQIARVVGLNAPSRAETKSTLINIEINATSEFAQWKRASIGLTETQKAAEFARIAAIPRDVPVIEAQPRMLGDGHVD